MNQMLTTLNTIQMQVKVDQSSKFKLGWITVQGYHFGVASNYFVSLPLIVSAFLVLPIL